LVIFVAVRGKRFPFSRIDVRVHEVIVHTRGQRKLRRPEQGRRLRKEEGSYVVEPKIRGAVKVCDTCCTALDR
jgi:hypothetical protein